MNKRTLWSKCKLLNFKARRIYSYTYHLQHIFFIGLSKQITHFFTTITWCTSLLIHLSGVREASF